VERQRIVDRGQVYCERRGRDIDVERCYTCRWFVDQRRVNGVEMVVCRVPVPLP
jgi:hypothetical protein